MAVPKKRTTKSKRNMRRSHHGASPIKLALCPKCKNPRPQHTACGVCGTYNNREVINVTRKIERAQQREKEKISNQ